MSLVFRPKSMEYYVVLYESGENLCFDITLFRQTVISFIEILFFHVFVL